MDNESNDKSDWLTPREIETVMKELERHWQFPEPLEKMIQELESGSYDCSGEWRRW